MIGFVEIVAREMAQAWPRAAGTALIAVSTPGCEIVARPHLRTLRLSFDALSGELEAASLRVVGAAAAVPFEREHAHRISAFVAELERDSQWIGLLVCESEGLTRSVTVGRWAARVCGAALHEPAAAFGVASCALMAGMLRRAACPRHEALRRVPVAATLGWHP